MSENVIPHPAGTYTPYITRALSRASFMTLPTSYFALVSELFPVALFASLATNSAVQGSIEVWHSGKREPLLSSFKDL